MRDIGLVVFDIDGTIRSADDPDCTRIEPTLDALDAAGIPWTFSTGRPYRSMLRATQRLFGHGRPRRPCANYNGGLVVGAGSPPDVTMTLMEPETVAKVLRIASALEHPVVVHSCAIKDGTLIEATRAGGHDPHTLDGSEFWEGVPEVHDSTLGHDEGVIAILIRERTYPTPDQVTKFQDFIGPTVKVSSSGYIFYEVSPPGVSKGTALPALAAHFGCTPENVMAIGDGMNDVEMLAAAGLGVAVGNAPEAVKTRARMVTRGHAASGASEAVSWLLGRRRAA